MKLTLAFAAGLAVGIAVGCVWALIAMTASEVSNYTDGIRGQSERENGLETRPWRLKGHL